MGYQADTETTVKGGMPVAVTGTVNSDEQGTWVEDITVCWPKSWKPVTDRFLDSLSETDWDDIADALAAA